MATIQLLVRDDANRGALASLVEQRHTPFEATELREADLYLVDDASFPQYRDALETHKNAMAPVFCPVVLIRRPQTPVTVDLSAPDPNDGPHVVNEVVDAPVEAQVLFRRFANLLVRRSQTATLAEQNERLEQFTKMVRHEVRNPLQVVDGFLDVARERGDQAAFDTCQAAIDRMARLFDDILLIVRDDEVVPDLERIDVQTICRESWRSISEPEAELTVETTRQVRADEDLFRQLLDNLFRNAVEHGGSDVHVRVGDLDRGLYVEDDGPGIPTEDRERVFESGYTTGGTETGFGLEVVENVTEAHGWTVQVTDGTRGGARFELTGLETV